MTDDFSWAQGVSRLGDMELRSIDEICIAAAARVVAGFVGGERAEFETSRSLGERIAECAQTLRDNYDWEEYADEDQAE